jgi:hypothetical protein
MELTNFVVNEQISLPHLYSRKVGRQGTCRTPYGNNKRRLGSCFSGLGRLTILWNYLLSYGTMTTEQSTSLCLDMYKQHCTNFSTQCPTADKMHSTRSIHHNMEQKYNSQMSQTTCHAYHQRK